MPAPQEILCKLIKACPECPDNWEDCVVPEILAWEITEDQKAAVVWFGKSHNKEGMEALAAALAEKHELKVVKHGETVVILESWEPLEGRTYLLFTLTVVPEYGVIVAYTDPHA